MEDGLYGEWKSRGVHNGGITIISHECH